MENTVPVFRYRWFIENCSVLELPNRKVIVIDPIFRKDEKGTYVEFEDETYKFQTGRDGYVVTTYLDRYEGKEVTQSRRLYTDTYKSVPDGYYVGIKNRDELYY